MVRHARLAPALFAALLLGLIPASASAQVGIGPRLSFIRGDVVTGTPSTRFAGGTLRIRSASRIVGYELALDYRATTNEEATSRVREMPVQASMLIFFGRGGFAPYVLGGFGIYSEATDTLDDLGLVEDTVLDRKTGWHMGAGAEMRLSRHAALFGDFRFRFVHFGEPDEDEEPIDLPGFDNFRLSHRGSMWTGGLAFYF